MSGWKKSLAVILVFCIASPVAAQSNGADAEARQKAREQAMEQRAQELESMVMQREQQAEAMEAQMREAEERLADAAARVAELSHRRLPQVVRLERQGRAQPVLGIAIGSGRTRGADGPVEGVTISGVTPGSAASDAGLRAGDVITGINGESFSAQQEEGAHRKLLDFMEGVEEGDILEVEYLRDGRAASVEVEPRPASGHMFSFRSGNRGFAMPAPPAAPGAHLPPNAPGFFSFYTGRGSWGDMEMVSLTKDLGRYFGTDKGLLVVRAPQEESLKLQDGDVIRRIDGREPTSVSHALRILGSYQGGETLEIEIMRDRKQQTVAVEMPDNRQSAEFGFSMSPIDAERIGTSVTP